MSASNSLLVVESLIATLEDLGLEVGDVISVRADRPVPVALHRELLVEADALVRFIETGALRFADPREPMVVAYRTRKPWQPAPAQPDQWAKFPLTLIRGGAS